MHGKLDVFIVDCLLIVGPQYVAKGCSVVLDLLAKRS
jgi:hypothetical protein